MRLVRNINIAAKIDLAENIETIKQLILISFPGIINIMSKE